MMSMRALVKPRWWKGMGIEELDVLKGTTLDREQINNVY